MKSIFIERELHLTVDWNSSSGHIREPPVLRYPTIMVTCPYPLFGVILMVILHVLIVIN